MLALALLLATAPSPDPFLEFLEGPPTITAAGPTERGSVALAVARGVVIAAEAGQVVVAHSLYDNHVRRDLTVTYTVERPAVFPGTHVAAGTPLGLGAAREWHLDGAPSSRAEVGSRPRFDPRAELVLVLVDHETYAVRMYARGIETWRGKIGFGQGVGTKVRQGDLKTPKGMYFVTKKHRGEFGGKWGAYYGGHWIKINYPNAYDADRGLDAGWLTRAQARDISTAWAMRALPSQKTTLGGGIGFHGWIEDWSDDDPHLSWGCMVMHNRDIKVRYDEIPVGAMVVIF